MTKVQFNGMKWIEDTLDRQQVPDLTDDQIRCFRVLCSISQPYNLPLIGKGWHDVKHGFDTSDYEDGEGPPVRSPINVTSSCIIARLHQELATFDAAHLSILVASAHSHAVRVSVSAEIYRAVDTESYVSTWDPEKQDWIETDEHPYYPMPCLTVMLHPRQRDGNGWQRHPDVDALASYAPEVKL